MKQILIVKLIFFFFFFSDIDECVVNQGGCAHNCTNKAGSFECSCRDGWKLNADGKSCDGKTIYLLFMCFMMGEKIKF